MKNRQETSVKHIKKIKPAPEKSATGKDGNPRPIAHSRPCIPVDG